MKKTFALVASVAAIAVAAPAAAQNQNPVVHALTGEVAETCTLADFQPSPIAINFGTLSAVDVGQQTEAVVNNVTVICNDPVGGTVTVTSANLGTLNRAGTSGGANNSIGYTVAATGGNGLAFAATTLASPVSKTFSASPALLAGSGLTFQFRANGVREAGVSGVNNGTRTTVFAGTYTDTVTVAVTAN